MNYKIIIQSHISSPKEEIIGVKENISEALEKIGVAVDYVNVMPSADEPVWERGMFQTFRRGIEG